MSRMNCAIGQKSSTSRPEQLKAAVNSVGTSAKDVEKHLQRIGSLLGVVEAEQATSLPSVV